jgi:O-antigen/teichoic acid export membrane protein
MSYKTSALKQVRLPKFITDVASMVGSRFVLLLLGVLGSVVIARLLGPEQKGILTTVLAVPGMVLGFADLGVRQAATYFLGKKLRSDQDILSTLAFLTVVTSGFALVLIFAIYLITGLPSRYGWIVVMIPLGIVPFRLVTSYGSGVLLAKQRIQELALVNVFHKVAYLLLLIPLITVLLRYVEWVLFAELLAVSIGALYVIRAIKKYGSLRPRYIDQLPWTLIKRGVAYAGALFILSLNYRIDILLLERLATVRDVGIYSVGVGLAEMLWMLPAAISTVNFARSSASGNAQDHAHKTAKVLRVAFWVALFPTLGLYFLAPTLIPLIYGIDFADSAYIVQAILLGVWFGLIFKILHSDLAGRGKPEVALWVFALTLVINIGLNLWWIPLFQGLGSAWASSISYTIGAVVFSIIYAHISKVNVGELFLPGVSDFQYITRKFSRRPKL